MNGFAADFRSSLRGLSRDRSVFLWGAVCLALGIGTSAAMFGLLDVLVFRKPAEVKAAEQLHRLYFGETIPGVGEFITDRTSYPTFCDLARGRSFAELGAYAATEVSVGRGEAAQKVRASFITPGFLPLLGVRPSQGRLFLEAEGAPESASFVALISHELWQHRFNGAPDVLSQSLAVGWDSYRIIGVLPRGFTGIDPERIDLWLPLPAVELLAGRRWASSRGSQFLEVVGRLPAGSPVAAAAEATALYRAGAADSGEPSPAMRVQLGPIQRAQGPEVSSSVRVAVWLAGLSGIVLLIACANAAGLLLVRALNRRQEWPVRLALGGGRGRLVRAMFLESGMLATVGGVVALGFCLVMNTVFQAVVAPTAGGFHSVWHPRSLLTVLAATLAATLLSAVLPALWVYRIRWHDDLRSGDRHAPRSRLSGSVAAAQIALTLTLVAGAGAFARSLEKAWHLDLGLDAQRVLVATVDLQGAGAPAARTDALLREAAERIRHGPGVAQASLATAVPFATSQAVYLAAPGGEPLPDLPMGGPYFNAVAGEFFVTTGTAVLRGRAFAEHEAAPVAMVNQTLARLLWPGREALGQCLQVGQNPSPCSQVVGIVEDARREALVEGPTAQCYIPLNQAPARLGGRALFVRAKVDPRTLAPWVRRELQAVIPDSPYVEVKSLAELLAPPIHPWRMGATVLTLFGSLGLALAMIGLYGVIAQAMARRRVELAVRIALGAGRRSVLGLVLRQGLVLALVGIGAGLMLTLAASRYLQPLLFQVSARDPWPLAAAAGLLLGVALLASYASSRRVRRLDPAKVLRQG